MKLRPRLLILALPALMACGTWNRDNPFDPEGTNYHLSTNAPVISSVMTANGQVTIGWGDVKGATSYDLYYTAGVTIINTSDTELAGMTSPGTVTGLTNDTWYTFAVSAVDSMGVKSLLSNLVFAKPSATPSMLSITAQPQSQSVMAGDTASFSVTVLGTAPVWYQWYKDDNLIPGATSSSYSISIVQPSDTGTYSVQVSNASLFFESTDAALTINTATKNCQWTAVNNGLTNTSVYSSLAINSSGNVFAGTLGEGVFMSTNNGASWSAANNSLTNYFVRALAVSGSGNVFAGTYGGVFLSTSNGALWSAINNGLTNTYVNALAVSAGGSVFAGTNGGGVFLSTNNGAGWTAVNKGITPTIINALAMSGSGNVFAGTYSGIFLSTNNGASWTTVNSGLSDTSVYSLIINKSGNVFAGTNGGIFLSTNNGALWTAVNNGLTNKSVYSLAISGSTIFAGTLGGGVFLSMNNGASWSAANNGLSNTSIYSLAISDSTIFAGTNGGGVFISPLP